MKKLITIAIVLIMVTALCVCPVLAAGGNGDGSGGGGGNAPLSVVSVTIDGAALDGAETGPDGTITISFDRGMNKNSATTAAAISITGADSTVSFDGDRTFTVSFSGLEPGTYTLVIGAAATANNGNTLGADYTATFTVKAADQPADPEPATDPEPAADPEPAEQEPEPEAPDAPAPGETSPKTGEPAVLYVFCAAALAAAAYAVIRLKKTED